MKKKIFLAATFMFALIGFTATAQSVEEKEAALQQVAKAYENGEFEGLDKQQRVDRFQELVGTTIDLEMKEATPKERRMVRKEARKGIKDLMKKDRKEGKELSDGVLVVIAIFIPFLAVGIHEGGLTGAFWLNLLLTLLFWLPGFIHALIVILG